MSTLVQYQTLFAIQQNTTDLDSLTEKPVLSATGDVGIEGTGSAAGVFVLPIEPGPSLSPSDVMQELEITTGKAQKFIQEYEATIGSIPSVSITGPCNSYIGSLLFWSLFQTGTSTTATSTTVTTMTCVPYTNSAPEMYFSLVKCMIDPATSTSVDTKSHYFTGCLVKSLTLTSEERQIVKYNAEILGTGFQKANSNIGCNTKWSGLSYPTATDSWKWQNFICKFGDTLTDADVLNMSLTFTNNVNAVFYNNTTIRGYKLGKIGVTGNCFMPWSTFTNGNDPLVKYEAGTDFGLDFYTDDGADMKNTANHVDFDLNIKITEIETAGDVEIGYNLTFEGLYDGTNNAADVRMNYLVAKLVRSVT